MRSELSRKVFLYLLTFFFFLSKGVNGIKYFLEPTLTPYPMVHYSSTVFLLQHAVSKSTLEICSVRE